MQVDYYFEKSSGLLVKENFEALRTDSKPDRRFSFYYETLTSTRSLAVINSEVLLDGYTPLQINNSIHAFSLVILISTVAVVSISSVAVIFVVKKLRK